MDYKISIIGGDLRLVYLANMLSESKKVTVFGNDHQHLSPSIKKVNNLEEAIDKSSLVIFPIPFSKEKDEIFAPFYKERIPYDALLDLDFSNKLVVGGAFPEAIKEFLVKEKVCYVDLNEDQEFALYNAIPTAEGVINIMMQESSITIYGSRCLILGFGKCGIVQAKVLEGMRPWITVAARNPAQIALAQVNGYQVIHLDELEKVIDDFDFIVNTIPAKRLGNDIISKIKGSVLIVDIANQLEDQVIDNRIKIINARGIPGKYSPKSAAEIIWKVLLEKNLLT